MAAFKIRLATASPGTQATTEETLAQLRQIASKAASNKADILLLPEAYLGGYPRGSDFGCKVGARTAGGRDEFLQYFHAAVDLGDTVGNGAGAGEAWVQRRLPGVASPAADTGGDGGSKPQRGDGTREVLEEIARDTNVFIVVGLVEKAGGSLYCAAVYVCPSRGIIGKRRKVQPVSYSAFFLVGAPMSFHRPGHGRMEEGNTERVVACIAHRYLQWHPRRVEGISSAYADGKAGAPGLYGYRVSMTPRDAASLFEDTSSHKRP